MNVEVVLLSVEAAGRIMSLGRSTLYSLILSGQLGSLRVGRRRLIPRQAIDDFIEKQLLVAEEAHE